MLDKEPPFRQTIIQKIPRLIPFALLQILVAFLIKIIFSAIFNKVELHLCYCYIGVVVALIAITFCFYIAIWILKHPTGNEQMNKIGNAILQGSQSFFSQQDKIISVLAVSFAVIIGALYGMNQNTLNLKSNEASLPATNINLGLVVAIGFLFGVFCSGCSGYAAMWISTRTNIRVAQAAGKSYNKALQLAFSGGYFGALFNIALAILGTMLSLLLLFHFMQYNPINPSNHIKLMISFGFGTCFISILSQIGGGIYTKASDIGADLVGKLEQGYPKDDQRNPIIIADLIGDNVGDFVGQSSDMFQSITTEIICAMILGESLSQRAYLEQDYILSFMFFPLIVHSLGIICSTLRYYFLEGQDYKDENTLEGPLSVIVSLLLNLVGFAYICYKFLNPSNFPNAWIYFAGCGICGLIMGYTNHKYNPSNTIPLPYKKGFIAKIISRINAGMEQTGIPIIIISTGILISFYFGKNSGIKDQKGQLIGGMFGVAIATMAALCTQVYVLSMSGFSAIAVNARGIAAANRLPSSERKITDKLYAVGNLTKANTKIYSVGLNGLTSFLLFGIFITETNIIIKEIFQRQFDIATLCVLITGLLGSISVIIFAWWSISAVSNAAQDTIKQAKQEFSKEVRGGHKKPNYAKCVALITKAAKKQMKILGILSLLFPFFICILKLIAKSINHSLLEAECICSYLMFSAVTAIIIALFFNNFNNQPWDNAQKYCELQGWQFQDIQNGSNTGNTAGTSINILLKLVCIVTLIMMPILV